MVYELSGERQRLSLLTRLGHTGCEYLKTPDLKPILAVLGAGANISTLQKYKQTIHHPFYEQQLETNPMHMIAADEPPGI